MARTRCDGGLCCAACGNRTVRHTVVAVSARVSLWNPVDGSLARQHQRQQLEESDREPETPDRNDFDQPAGGPPIRHGSDTPCRIFRWYGQRELADRCGSKESGSYVRSEEHTSELQSLMSSSYAVFCL